MPASSPPSSRAVLTSVPLLILLHNLEEALTMAADLPTLNAHLPGSLRALTGPIAADQFHLALAGVTLLPFLVLPGLLAEDQPGWGHAAMLALLATMLLNVGAHVGMAVLLGGYAPGLVTALGVLLPGAAYGLTRAVRERWLGDRGPAFLLGAAVLLHGPGLIGLMVLAGRLASP